MMNIHLLVNLALGLLLALTVVADLRAGEAPHATTEEMVEFSLMRLKDSVQKTAQKNERVAFENDALKASIQELDRKKTALSRRKAELLGIPYSKQEQLSSSRDMGSVDIGRREQKVRGLIAAFKEDNGRIMREIRMMDEAHGKRLSQKNSKDQLKEKKKVKKSVSRARSRLADLQRKNAKYEKKMKALNEEKMSLLRALNMLERSRRRF